jgi:hypothetical protein
MTMTERGVRGSELLLDAWKHRTISDELVGEVAHNLGQSPATVDDVLTNGDHGLGFSLTYTGDEIDRCGNDLQWLLDLIRKYGVPYEEPVVIINGRPRLDRVTVLATLGVLPANAWDAVIPQHRAAHKQVG